MVILITTIREVSLVILITTIGDRGISGNIDNDNIGEVSLVILGEIPPIIASGDIDNDKREGISDNLDDDNRGGISGILDDDNRGI